MTEKKIPYINSAKDTMKVGITTMGGSFALGAMGSIPGMPAQAQSSLNIAQSGLNLANISFSAKDRPFSWYFFINTLSSLL